MAEPSGGVASTSKVASFSASSARADTERSRHAAREKRIFIIVGEAGIYGPFALNGSVGPTRAAFNLLRNLDRRRMADEIVVDEFHYTMAGERAQTPAR